MAKGKPIPSELSDKVANKYPGLRGFVLREIAARDIEICAVYFNGKRHCETALIRLLFMIVKSKYDIVMIDRGGINTPRNILINKIQKELGLLLSLDYVESSREKGIQTVDFVVATVRRHLLHDKEGTKLFRTIESQTKIKQLT